MKLSFKKILIFILCISFLVRLYKITTPLADWHSFRQADTASVTREYVKHGVDLLHPRYHDLSNVQSGVLTGGKDNLEGWRMVEFPFINALIATLIRTIPSLDLVITSRLFSILASLITITALALIGKKIFDDKTGLAAAAVFGLLPFSVFYSRVILPEPFLVMWVCLSLLAFLLYVQTNKIQYALGWVIAFCLALLLKPMAVFFVPAFAGMLFVYKGVKKFLNWKLFILGGLSVIPLLLWRKWITQYPTGIPWSVWLYNLDGIRLRPAWWRWLFWERLTKLWLGFAGLLFVFEGLLPTRSLTQKKRSPVLVLYAWGIGMFAYLVVFATGNVRHDYYQVMLLPFVALVAGRGIVLMLSDEMRIQLGSLKLQFTKRHRSLRAALTVLACCLSLFFSYQRVQGYYAINHWEIVEAGKAADRLLPPDAKVIAPYVGDTAFLFATNRTGWPIGLEIEKKIENGADYYVSVNYDDEARNLEKKFKTVEKTDKYIILNLHERIKQTETNQADTKKN